MLAYVIAVIVFVVTILAWAFDRDGDKPDVQGAAPSRGGSSGGSAGGPPEKGGNTEGDASEDPGTVRYTIGFRNFGPAGSHDYSRQAASSGAGRISVTADIEEPEEMDKEAIDAWKYGRFRVFCANSIINPFGPTYQFLSVINSEIKPGTTATLYNVCLNPKYPALYKAGFIEFPAGWNGSWEGLDVEGLSDALEGVSARILTAGLWLPAHLRRKLLETVYTRHGSDIPQVLAQAEVYPRDIFSRFDSDMAILFPERGDKAIPKSRLLSPKAAVAELTRKSLDGGFQEQEFVNLTENWASCVDLFLHGDAVITIKGFMAFYVANLHRELYGFNGTLDPRTF